MTMPSKPKPKPDDAAQSKRFIETAKEVGADEDAEALDRAFSKIGPPKRSSQRSSSSQRGCPPPDDE